MRYLFIAFVVLFSVELFAKPINGIYVELGAGQELEDKIENYVYDKNYILDAILGYQYNLYRFEAEYSKRSAELYSNGSLPADGDITQNTAMFNIYFRSGKGIKKNNLFKRCFINIIISPKKLLTIFMCRIMQYFN